MKKAIAVVVLALTLGACANTVDPGKPGLDKLTNIANDFCKGQNRCGHQ